MNIKSQLVFKKACSISGSNVPVEGVKELVVGDKKISIDFGNGDCDKLATITIKSKSKVVEVSGN